MKFTELKKMIGEVVSEEILQSKDLEGPYTVYVKTGRLAGQTIMAKKHKQTGLYYYLNPDTGHDEPIGDEKSVDVQKKLEQETSSRSKQGDFQEGVGAVYAKERKKDPKHIDGEHWRIKFQSAKDLKKHGITEEMMTDEGNGGLFGMGESITKSELKGVIRGLINEMWADIATGGKQKQGPTGRGTEAGADESFVSLYKGGGHTSGDNIGGAPIWRGGKGDNSSETLPSVGGAMSETFEDSEFKSGMMAGSEAKRDGQKLAKNPVGRSRNWIKGYKTGWMRYKELPNPNIKTEPDKETQSDFGFDKPEFALGDYEKYGSDKIRTEDVIEGKKMNEQREYLRKLIREAIQEVEAEDYEFKEQQETLAMKRIQSYAHWIKHNLAKHPNEISTVINYIVKEIDGLVTAHEKGEEVSPVNTAIKTPKSPVTEKSPPGWSGTTKAMKKHKDIDNPFALSWWMKKRGAHPHYKPEKKS